MNQNQIIHNITNNIISKKTMETQTEKEEITIEEPVEQTSHNFDKYMDELCIIRPDVEVSSVDILGQYRIWSKTATKKIYHDLKDYLDTKFKCCRLSIQNKNQVVNGYKGITLREIQYKRKLIPCDVENFIFHACVFHPSGKVLHTTLYDEYIKWKKNTGKNITNIETDELRKYLKETEYTLFTTIWTSSGNGQGYYGISLKSENTDHHKKTSATGKKVEKRQLNTNILLGTWETIAKAAIDEKISAAKLSRIIKNKTSLKLSKPHPELVEGCEYHVVESVTNAKKIKVGVGISKVLLRNKQGEEFIIEGNATRESARVRTASAQAEHRAARTSRPAPSRVLRSKDPHPPSCLVHVRKPLMG
jgi:hypothetical protein